MSNLSDFLNENGFSADDVSARSKAIEHRDHHEKALAVRRADARRLKKTYQELELGKPSSLRRGVSPSQLKAAVAGEKVPRLTRKKITRAVNSLLVSKKKDPVEWRVLFQDVGAHKGKTKKKK